jgi:intracellular septation protein
MYVALLVFQLIVFPLTYLLPADPAFIKWKISFYYGLFGIALIISGIYTKRGIIGLLKPKGINMPEFIWPKIDLYFSVVFILLALLNAWFVLYMTENHWVNFKLFVPVPVLAIYTIFVSLLVSKNIIENEQKIA